MRQTFVILCFFLACSVLGPVMFDLWIYYGNANANFFFGTTLAFNAAQVSKFNAADNTTCLVANLNLPFKIFLITDILFAYIKREYHLINGLKPQIDGELGKLALK